MTTDSKIRFFLITIAFTIIISSCNKSNDVIPDVTIDFSLDINDPQFTDLASFGGIALVNSKTNNLGPYAAGYDGNGIIIFAGVEEFYAYDRTCPHDYAVNGLSIKVNIDPTNSLNSICPECNTNYALAAGGTPLKGGIGRYPLKNYKTSFSGQYIRVWN